MNASRPLDLLLVDDDPDVLSSVGRILQQAHVVRTAPSVAVALREIADRVPEVLVSDLHMEPLDGADLLRHVAEAHPSVRRVIHSGADCRALVEAGVAHAALRKPASLAGLLGVIGSGAAPSEGNAGLPWLHRNSC